MEAREAKESTRIMPLLSLDDALVKSPHGSHIFDNANEGAEAKQTEEKAQETTFLTKNCSISFGGALQEHSARILAIFGQPKVHILKNFHA